MTSIADRDGQIWKDGEWVDWRECNVHLLTHSLHYGLAVFEGVRAYPTANGPALFRLRKHTARLMNSAHIYQMKVPHDFETLVYAQVEAVRLNGLESAYVRPMVWLGAQKMGISIQGNPVHVAVAAWAMNASYLGEEGVAKGIRVKTSSIARHHVNVALVRAKASGHYVNSILANQEAMNDGYDEALMLDTAGYVSEGPGANVFIVKNGKLITPDLTSCLEGITRDTVLTLARDANIPTIERPLTRDDVYSADEAFFTGTAAEITPICELDRRQIGRGSRGELTEFLQGLYCNARSGKAPRYAHWLTTV